MEMTIPELVKKLLEIKDALKKEAEGQFSEEDCPLNRESAPREASENKYHHTSEYFSWIEHNHLSQFLWGGGYEWACGFCGARFDTY